MKVFHVYKQYLPDSYGGIEQVIYQLCEGTLPLGVDPHVFALTSKKPLELRVGSHQVHRILKDIEVASTPFSIKALFKYKKLIQEADLVHYHFPYPFGDVLYFLGGTTKPSVVTYHSDIIKQKNLLKLYSPLMHRFLSKMSVIVASSPNYLKTSQVLNTYKDKTQVVPFGISEKSYPKVNLKIQTEYKKKYGDKFFLFLGTFRYYKGLLNLVEAAKEADFPVVLAGSGFMEETLKKKVSQLGLRRLYFTGSVNDEEKVALLDLCWAFVFPSHLRSEAFGVSLLEAAMFSKPLISCEIGTGTSYVNEDGVTGRVVPPNSPKDLFSAMDFLWKNPEKAKTMGEEARKRQLNYFTVEKMSKSYFEIYKSLL